MYDSTMYSFIDLLFSIDIFMTVSLFFSMFVITIIVAVALVVFISLFYLYVNKIRKKMKRSNYNYYMKMLYFHK